MCMYNFRPILRHIKPLENTIKPATPIQLENIGLSLLTGYIHAYTYLLQLYYLFIIFLLIHGWAACEGSFRQ